ncbi:MAG TPA: biotin/lipoyl-containing protein, partial [Candidatus Nanopelagicales bacterium]|nr:biotin/lipoyl-containing protein [Candidatus Nanopelagicales bacterium]
SRYDPMLAKIITWGSDRTQARQRLDRALAETVVLGLGTNIAFLRELLQDPAVVAGDLDTGLVERLTAQREPAPVPDAVYVAAALRAAARAVSGDPWQATDGWRLGERGWSSWRFQVAGAEPVPVRVRADPAGGFQVAVGNAAPAPWRVRCAGDVIELTPAAGPQLRFRTAADGAVRWLGRAGAAWALRELERYPRAQLASTAASSGVVRSPMPGTVLEVRAQVGDPVSVGTALVVVEAMKMEHVVTATVAGTVEAVHVAVGDRVALEQALAQVAAEPGPDEAGPDEPGPDQAGPEGSSP